MAERGNVQITGIVGVHQKISTTYPYEKNRTENWMIIKNNRLLVYRHFLCTIRNKLKQFMNSSNR